MKKLIWLQWNSEIYDHVFDHECLLDVYNTELLLYIIVPVQIWKKDRSPSFLEKYLTIFPTEIAFIRLWKRIF